VIPADAFHGNGGVLASRRPAASNQVREGKKEKENAGAPHQDRFIKLKLVDSRVVPGCPAAAHHAGRWRERCC